MKESIIYQIAHTYRDDFRVRAFTFGQGEKALCVVGNIRGNEYQQIYICSHVRMMRTGFENRSKAADFGLPYIVIREPRPYDTTTLNYNWQIWETDAYSLYSNTTSRIDPVSAEQVVDGIERFMICNGILEGTPKPAAPSRVFQYSDLINIRTAQAGLYRSMTPYNSKVSAGQELAQIIDPCRGAVLETLVSPVDGIVFFQHNEPLIYAHTSALKILED